LRLDVDTPAPLCVTVLVRALDTGPRVDRVWRLSSSVGAGGVRLLRDLPFEAGRPVEIELALPGESFPLVTVGVVTSVRDGDAPPRAAAITFTALDAKAREQLDRYVEERLLSS
jgi:hypothetical protein